MKPMHSGKYANSKVTRSGDFEAKVNGSHTIYIITVQCVWNRAFQLFSRLSPTAAIIDLFLAEEGQIGLEAQQPCAGLWHLVALCS